MNAQDLKNSILQLAIQGKLVEQREEEGTAKELLEKIEDEKEKLIKEGKIKKTKLLPEITPDEIPFDIPESWKWVYINEVAFVTKLAGFEYTKNIAPNLSKDGIPLFKGKNVQSGNIVLEFESFIPEEISNELQRSQITRKCLLTPYVGTIGNIAIFNGDFKAHLGPNVGKVEIFNNSNQYITEEYLLYFLWSKAGYKELTKYKKATAQESISIDAIRNVIFPVPPLEEQKRIVAKIEELMLYVEKYDKTYSEVEGLNKKFPEDMQKSILQYAIQGKLVEQREEEGTAEELYQQIQEEKKRLVKEGKIKKEKPLPEITEDEMPFEIPGSWKWVRLKSIVYNRGQMTPKEKFSYIDIGSINNREQKLNDDENIVEPSKAPSRARKVVDYGDILYSTVRPYLHNMCIIDREFTHPPIASTGFAVMTCCSGVYNKFLFYYLLAPSFDSYANSNENSKGVAYPAINDDRLYRALIPLPPLEEQKRIVEKIEGLLPLSKQLIK